MPASKPDKSAPTGGLLSAIFRPSRRWALLLVALLIVGGAAWGGYAVWQQIRGEVAASDDYRLTPQQIEITPPPPWVRAT